MIKRRIKYEQIELINDDFDAYFKACAMALLDAIEFAMGKSISDRGTEETVKRFGCSLE